MTLLVLIYFAGLIYCIKAYKTIPDVAKDNRWFRFGYVTMVLIWPIFAIMEILAQMFKHLQKGN